MYEQQVIALFQEEIVHFSGNIFCRALIHIWLCLSSSRMCSMRLKRNWCVFAVMKEHVAVAHWRVSSRFWTKRSSVEQKNEISGLDAHSVCVCEPALLSELIDGQLNPDFKNNALKSKSFFALGCWQNAREISPCGK